MYTAGGRARRGAPPDGPRPHLVGSDREERDEVEQPVRRPYEPRQRRLGEAEVLEKRRSIFGIQAADFRLDACRQHEARGIELLDSRAEFVGQRFRRPVFAAIQCHEQLAVGE